jgi:hypothetical protein
MLRVVGIWVIALAMGFAVGCGGGDNGDQAKDGDKAGQNGGQAGDGQNQQNGGQPDGGGTDGQTRAMSEAEKRFRQQLGQLLGHFQKFMQEDASPAELTRELKPRPEDLDAIFSKQWAKVAKENFPAVWKDTDPIRPGENAVGLSRRQWISSTDGLRTGRGPAAQIFPGEWRAVAPFMEDDLLVVGVQYVDEVDGKPQLGNAYWAMVLVNGRWVYLPSPDRLLALDE